MINSTPRSSPIAKFAANDESVSLIPMPTSAYLIAIRSLAPSPHIPTFAFGSVVLYIYLNLRTIRAFDSGEIRANSFIVLGRAGSVFILRKSLSMAMGRGWLRYCSNVRKIGSDSVETLECVSNVPL